MPSYHSCCISGKGKALNTRCYEKMNNLPAQVSSLRSCEEVLFVSYVPPYSAITSKTLARWLTTLLTMAGVDTTTFRQHVSRAASAAFHRTDRQLSVQQICALADWSDTSGVFDTFYKRYFE